MMVHIGHDNYVEGHLVAVLLKPDGASVRRLKKDASDQDRLITATNGHKTRTVIVLSTGQVVLSALTTQCVRDRVNDSRKKKDP